MTIDEKRALKVFLCHASGDKPQVRTLYKRLVEEGVDAWLDQEKLLPGQDWRVEIPRAVQDADVVVVCLSNKSITKEGYIQKEIKFALDNAEEKPDGTIFLIPARLEDCTVPETLSRWQWVDLFEGNGYLKLLLSLKLRANKVGAVIIPTLGYRDDDVETNHRLDQYYTEGLAAFYTEDWDKACQRFQLILRERPNDKNATEKLEEADRQREFSRLYIQSMDAYRTEDWLTAIKFLEELLKKSPDYKDSMQLHKNAKKQNHLKELHIEAEKLYAAQKWEAVLKVFEQIIAIEPNNFDPKGLLPSAQKEAMELKRLSNLNDLYSKAVREVDMGKWYEARELLELVRKAQTDYLETERLFKKIEAEISKLEDINKQNNLISTLYEQAHGLIRSNNWRKALEKIKEIQSLDIHFEDKDGIAEKAEAALQREEQEEQKQNLLAAIYADAVRLMKEGKYLESLEKLGDVRAIDPNYPDRQRVQIAARKKIAEAEAHSNGKSRGLLWAVITVFIIIIAVVFVRGINIPSTTATPSSPPTTSPTTYLTSTPFVSHFWGFDTEIENWSGDTNNITYPLALNGYLTFETKRGNAYINSPASLNIPAEQTPLITLRMKISKGSSGSIYFITKTDNEWNEKKRVFFFIKDYDAFQTYNITMPSISNWQGVVTQLRLVPVDGDFTSVKVEIDYISVHDP